MIDNKKLILNFKSRISTFLCLAIIGMFMSGFLAQIITYFWGENTSTLRISTIIQNVFFFISPAIIIALFITKLPADFLQLRKAPSLKGILLTIAIILLSIPAMNFIIYCNESIVFPDALRGLENSLKALEASTREQIKILLGEPNVASLIMSILIIGILTGVGEELFFRGALQNIIRTRPMNPHYAIWITAVVFSILHFQFYGFIPRVLIGAFFGYLTFWSGSIWLPIFAHALNNSLVVITTWISSRNVFNFDINKIATDFSVESYLLIIISAITTSLMIIQLYRHYSNKERASDK